MRQLSDWNKFTMKIKNENPDMAFKDVLALAGEMKRNGTDIVAYTRGMKVAPKKAAKRTGKKAAKKTGKKAAKKAAKKTGKKAAKKSGKKTGRKTRKNKSRKH